MRKFLLMTLLLCATGCGPAIRGSLDAACDGNRAARADLAAALASTPDEAVLRAGARLIALDDAACAQ